MTKLLIKLFIKNHDNIKDRTVREKYGLLSGAVGIFTNIVLFVFKLVVGIVSGSIAIIADAVNNISDAASSIIMFVGIKMSGKPADEEHPYGHARIEYVTGLVISFIILFVGGQFVITSINKIINPSALELNFPMFAVLLGAILIKLWLCLFYRRIAKITNSVAIMASSKDSRNDVIATLVVFVSSIVFKYSGINIDGYAGLFVAVFIIFSGISIVKETINPLLGIMPDGEVIEKIKEKILSYENVMGVHDLVIHNYGYDRIFASVHVEMEAEKDILDSHAVIDMIEKDFMREENINLVIHLDPVVTNDEEINRLSAVVDGIIKEIDPIITKHDFRIVVSEGHKKLVFDIDLPPKHTMSDKKITELINKKIKKYDSALDAVIMIDRSYTSAVF